MTRFVTTNGIAVNSVLLKILVQIAKSVNGKKNLKLIQCPLKLDEKGKIEFHTWRRLHCSKRGKEGQPETSE